MPASADAVFINVPFDRRYKKLFDALVFAVHLRDLVPGYLSRREDLMELASAIASKREVKAPAEAQAARILFSRIKNERLG